MIFSNPIGLRVFATAVGNSIRYQVLEQSPEVKTALDALPNNKVSVDTYSLKMNRKPDYNRNTKTFYLRGSDDASDDIMVEKEMPSRQDALEAVIALGEMVSAIVPFQRLAPSPGGTTHCRQAIITRDQAMKLSLTGKRHYPNNRSWPGNVEPYHTGNEHWDEHIGQFVDVLNKSLVSPDSWSEDDENENVVNPHYVDPESARRAVEIARSAFDTAEQAGESTLIALWRIFSGLRGIDDPQITALSRRHAEANH